MASPDPVPATDINPSLIIRAAYEGVPVAAIARILKHPFGVVNTVLDCAVEQGRLGMKPQSDWPPNGKWSARTPVLPTTMNADDIEFYCARVFHLTRLETGFLVVLLRYERVEKERLHNVVEQQREKRQQRLNKAEPTDPKMVDVIICKLRKKLRAADELFILCTSWGKGYYFEPETKRKIFERIGAE